MTITELIKRSHALSREKGFYDPPPTFGDQVALAHSELSEALDAYRKRGLEAWLDGQKPEGVAAELADVVIRVCDMAGAWDIDLEAAIEAKHAYNVTRPYRHGNKRL